MSTFQLKLLAVVLMVIDHIGFFLFPTRIVWRIIGRLSFPIFAFLIVNGLQYTKNRWRYFSRLFVFANIIQIPSLFMDIPINIFYTLSFGLLCIIVLKEKWDWIYKITCIFLVLIMTDVLGPDYGLYGVLLIVTFHLLRKRWVFLAAAITLLGLFFYGWDIQLLAVFAIIPIYFYNKKEGPRWKVFFYSFYPVHIVFLEWLGQRLG